MEIKIIDERVGAFEPATAQSAGFDLRACNAFGEKIEDGGEIWLPRDATITFGTGIAIDLGSYECSEIEGGITQLAAMILPRSGMGCKGIKPANSPGLIDADYQGEIKVCLTNQGHDDIYIKSLDRIAQLVIVPTFKPQWLVVGQFSRITDRSAGGFGSTGNG